VKSIRYYLISLLLATGLSAREENQPAKIPQSTVDVDLTVKSNFIDRGEDRGRNRSVQRGTAYNSTEAPGYFQPNIKINTPLDGLYFNIFSSMALSHRNDHDVDQRLQTGPAGSQTILADSVNPYINTSLTPGAYVDSQLATAYVGNLWQDKGVSDVPLYAFYKEENGLKRGDQIDTSLGYAKDTTLGSFDFGIVSSTRLDSRGKSNPFADSGANYQKTEMYVTYGLTVLRELTLTFLTDVVNSDQYWKFQYSKEFELSESQKIDASAGVAYGVQPKLTGLMDVPLVAGYTIYGFRLGIEAVYRPDSRMYDAQYSGDTNSTRLIQADGGSNITDRLIPDPSRTKGFANQVMNSYITSAVRAQTGNVRYNYTPRQRIPAWLYAVSIGYSASF